MTTITNIDSKELESKVKAMYRDVAENPHGDFHFEMGRKLAERLGYSPTDLDRIPTEAIESFAGVGHYFHFADLKQGEAVLDLGSGSGRPGKIRGKRAAPPFARRQQRGAKTAAACRADRDVCEGRQTR